MQRLLHTWKVSQPYEIAISPYQNQRKHNTFLKMKIITSILLTAIVILAMVKLNRCTEPKPDGKEHLLEIRAKQLEHEAQYLDSIAQYWHDSATRSKATAYIYRTRTEYVRLHDTLRQRFTDSTYCMNLEAENSGLWETVWADSVAYAAKVGECLKKDSVIRLKDSTNYLLRQGREKLYAKLRKKNRELWLWRIVSGGLIINLITR